MNFYVSMYIIILSIFDLHTAYNFNRINCFNELFMYFVFIVVSLIYISG